MKNLHKKQIVMLCSLFVITEYTQASTTSTSSTVPTKESSTNKKSVNKSSMRSRSNLSAHQPANQLTSTEKQMIQDFIQKAHAIPDKQAENKDHKKFRSAVDAAYRAYEKMYHYENYISADGMNISNEENKKIKDAAKILFNARHIENMVWQLKKDKKKKANSTK